MAEATAPVVLVAHPGAELYGSDRMLLESVRGFVDAGWRVVLALPEDGPLVAEAEAAGAQVELVASPVLRKRLLRPSALLPTAVAAARASRAIDLLLRRVRPDALYLSTVTLPLWAVVARARRTPVLCHVHESERAAPRLLRTALAAPLLLARSVVVNSAFSRDSLTEVVPALAPRSVVVYNGVAGPAAPSAPRARLVGPMRIVYVGRLSPRKGPDVAIDALARLGRDGVDATLDLVGGVFEGYEWYEQRLREQVAELGLEHRVRFLGFRSDVWGALADADVAVVPSREEEPFGNTAVEAVLAVRPAAVSAIGGLAEAVAGIDSAVPVAPGDAAALADALHRIATGWIGFRRAAITSASDAALRYAPARYRADVLDVLERTTRTTTREAVGA